MTLTDVLTLARAGYTAQQIAALAAAPASAVAPAAAAAPAAPAAAPVAAAAPVQLTGRPEAVPAAAYMPATTGAPADPIAALTGKLDALTAAIQANGLANAQQPTQQSAEDIIAAIIAPPVLDGNKQ